MRAGSLVPPVLVVVVALGCSAAPASTSGSARPGASLVPSPGVTSSQPAGSGGPTMAPGPVEGWQQMGEPPAFRAATVERIGPLAEGFVAVGCAGTMDDCESPAIWTSPDGLDWSGPVRLPLLPGEDPRSARAAISTAAGILVGGDVGRDDRIQAALWLVPGRGGVGRIAPIASFADASVADLLVVDDRLLAVGSGAFMDYAGFRAWHSDDGVAWVPDVTETRDEAAPTAVLAYEDGIVAWGPTCGVCVPETAFWRSTDGVAWSGARRELEGQFAHATVVAATSAGLVAFGTTGVDPPTPSAWLLADGADRWEPRDAPPQPDSTFVRAHLSVGDGAVAAGTSQLGDRPAGLVWLAGPGEPSWRQPITLPGIEVMSVFPDPARSDGLVLAGRTSAGERSAVSLWLGSVDWASPAGND